MSKNRDQSKKKKESSTECTECKYVFANVPNLIRHMKMKHNAPRTYGVKENYLYNCECGKNFNIHRLYKFHLKKVHNRDVSTLSGKTKKCAFCEFAASRKEDLVSHYTNTHEIEIDVQELTFSGLSEFCEWKSNIQDAAFSTEYTKIINKCKHISYTCNRSGHYQPTKKTGERIRSLKSQGSSKINAFCPAFIKVREEDDGVCLVEYINTHVGHADDIEHLKLNPKERNELAVKIANGVPFETILNEIRDSSDGDSLKRIRRTTVRDLHNIKFSFKLDCNSGESSCAFVDMNNWVTNGYDNDSVLVYKPIGQTSSEHSDLQNDDFVLILMNQCQSEILKTYSNQSLCVDRSYDLNKSGFELATLMVIDEKRQGFPCAFLLTNKVNSTILKLFYSELKKWTGVLSTKVFISDVDPMFYASWKEVMKPVEDQVYSSWLVDRSLKENLDNIKDLKTRLDIYRRLKTLLDKKQSDFAEAFTDFSDYIEKNTEAINFANYFFETFQNTYKFWTDSYIECHNNEPLERMNRIIEYIYLHEKNLQNYQSAIYDIMKFVRDTMFINLNLLNKMNIGAKLQMVRSEHNLSLLLDVKNIREEDECWEVLSTGDNKSGGTYKIIEISKMCSCRLQCPFCNVCIHKYSCSCISSVVEWNMCKHIHLLCRYFKEIEQNDSHSDMASVEDEPICPKSEEDSTYSASVNSDPSAESSETIGDFNVDDGESRAKRRKIKKELIDNPFEKGIKIIAETSFNKEKERLRSKLMKHIESIESLEDLNVFKDCLAPLSKHLSPK